MKKILYIACLLILVFSTVSYASVEVPDTVRVKLNDGSIIEVDFDEYLYGVVSSEMGTSYKENGEVKEVGIEALKAQAVASRTYALYNIQHSKYEGYDMTSTTSDQVYKAGNVKDIVKEAVDSTSGQVMTYDGEVISAFFFSTSGGHTEAPENIWSSSLPYLVGVEDTYEPYIEGKSEWEARISKNKYGSMEILEVSENGRVTKMKIGSEIYTKNNIRTKLGSSLVKSTWFEMTYDSSSNEYVLNGKGYGHGVGMSQYGAMGMAENGFNYVDILNWYYKDIEIWPDITYSNKVDNNSNTTKVNSSNVKTNKNNQENQKNQNEENIKENDYSDSKPTIKKNKKEYGPMLKDMIDKINAIGSWR